VKVTFISNATAIYEHQGYRLLADPWLTEPIFYGTWFHDPPISTRPQDVTHVDALYISHLHQDHCDPETLKHFRRDIPIVTLRDSLSLCAKHLERMGFSNIQAMASHEARRLGPFDLTIFGTFVKHPYVDCDIGNVMDSALLVDDGVSMVLNCNDNTPSIAAAEKLRDTYGRVDLAQINYNAAGPYPACFANLTPVEKQYEHHAIIERQLAHMAAVARALGARYVQPFAGAYKLGGPSAHLNEWRGVTSAEHAAIYLRERDINAVHLKEGETWIS
jgi:UDP-MurNAc hydroxylase